MVELTLPSQLRDRALRVPLSERHPGLQLDKYSAPSDQEGQREPLLEVASVVAEARRAKENGADRFCMGAAWREVRDGAEFDRVLEMVREVKDLGLETCVTLGMVCWLSESCPLPR